MLLWVIHNFEVGNTFLEWAICIAYKWGNSVCIVMGNIVSEWTISVWTRLQWVFEMGSVMSGGSTYLYKQFRNR